MTVRRSPVRSLVLPVAVLLGVASTAAGCGGDDDLDVSPVDTDQPTDEPTDEPSTTPAGDDTLVLTGAIEDTRTETSDDVVMRDVGGCMGGEYAIGVFVDVGSDADRATLYTVGATAPEGVVDLDTTGDVDVEIELVALYDIMDNDDDVSYEGDGTLTIVRQEIVEREDAYAETEYSLTGTVSDRNGDSVDVRLDGTAPFACTGL